MFRFRVTKYDPQYRDASGAYRRDDWTSHSQVGRVHAGKELLPAEYEQVETAYIEAAVGFLREAGIRQLVVRGFENPGNSHTAIKEGAVLSLEQAAQTVRAMLRDEFWCRLETQSAYIHIGWDFYMYVGVPVECPSAQAAAKMRGLFVESFASPYSENAA